MEKYEEANALLKKIPDTVIDATIMKTSVLAHQEGTDTAALFLEGKLLQAVINVQSYLYKLIEMEEETGNHDKAEKIAEVTDQMISLFGLWNYGNTVPYLLIAGYRKNVEKCVQLIKQLLSESQKPWNMTQSPLYYRYEDTAQGKAFSGIGKNFVRELYSEIENKKEYEFLRGNKELESIFEEHLKQVVKIYRNGTGYSDTYAADDKNVGWFADATAYNNLKNSMLKSVYENGGFYVGRYEAGIDTTTGTNRTSKGPTNSDGKYTIEGMPAPVTKADAYPYTYVTRTQAQNLASKVNAGTKTSSLMFGVQWDLVLAFMSKDTAKITSTDVLTKDTTTNNKFKITFTTPDTIKAQLEIFQPKAKRQI